MESMTPTRHQTGCLALVTGGDRLERDRVYYELAELFGFDYSMDTLEELKEGGYLDE